MVNTLAGSKKKDEVFSITVCMYSCDKKIDATDISEPKQHKSLHLI